MLDPTRPQIGAAQPQVMAPQMGARPVSGLFARPTPPPMERPAVAPAAPPPNGGPADTSRGPLSPADLAKIQGFEGLDRIYPRAAQQMQQQAPPTVAPPAPMASMNPNPAQVPFPPTPGRAIPNSLAHLGARAVTGDREV